jgi:hypothetical protein
MNKGTKISFIPKKPLVRKIEKNSRPISALLFASFGIFFITLALFGGLYLYTNNLKTVLEEKTKKLEVEKNKVDPSGVIDASKVLQEKISKAKDILNKHIALSRMFDVLEKITLKNIVLNGFTLEKSEKGDTGANNGVGFRDGSQTAQVAGFEISTSGTAPSYAALAYQSDVLKDEIKENRRIESFSISNPALDQDGNVIFDIKISLNPSFLLYEATKKENTGGFSMPVPENKDLLVNTAVGKSDLPDTEGQAVSSTTAATTTAIETQKESTSGVEVNSTRPETGGIFSRFTDFFKKILK